MPFNFRLCCSELLSEVRNVEAAPMLLQVFRHQSAMAVMRLVFAAEQAALSHDFLRDALFNLPLLHEVEKPLFIGGPVPLQLLVFIEHLPGRGEVGRVHVIHAAHLLEEEREVVPLGEPGELRDVVEAHVHDALGPGLPERVEKLPRALLGESDGKYFHGESSRRLMGARASST